MNFNFIGKNISTKYQDFFNFFKNVKIKLKEKNFEID
ncbi:hypothetical protein SAMN04488104_100554 [Algoriphagus faecimaris]|uniref:Uncharacterized protein n=1 Tax=Algoriphagus faecimaris TaxID=686796 RepID=A0A1G6P5F2_9BACT|nr:hypothetical protein SAMN04488104_100554 [Algoriphagus faecimaris]